MAVSVARSRGPHATSRLDFAQGRGARALEGYPMITESGQDAGLPVEDHVGSRTIFEAAGFTEITHPTIRRVVMRIDF
jgi:hypothetical protein